MLVPAIGEGMAVPVSFSAIKVVVEVIVSDLLTLSVRRRLALMNSLNKYIKECKQIINQARDQSQEQSNKKLELERLNQLEGGYKRNRVHLLERKLGYLRISNGILWNVSSLSELKRALRRHFSNPKFLLVHIMSRVEVVEQVQVHLRVLSDAPMELVVKRKEIKWKGDKSIKVHSSTSSFT
ncbi:hypothetical protein LguiB_012462 [Lonicera macranthoides]